MKNFLIIFTFVSTTAYSQKDEKAIYLIGSWSFSKRICVLENDTVIQLRDPKKGEVSDTTRPYTDIELYADNTYKTEVSFFKSKVNSYSGVWSIKNNNQIIFTDKFENDPTIEFSGKIESYNSEKLVLNNENRCLYFFLKKP